MPACSRPPWYRNARGEWYVIVQFALIALVFLGPRSLPGVPPWPASMQRITPSVSLMPETPPAGADVAARRVRTRIPDLAAEFPFPVELILPPLTLISGQPMISMPQPEPPELTNAPPPVPPVAPACRFCGARLAQRARGIPVRARLGGPPGRQVTAGTPVSAESGPRFVEVAAAVMQRPDGSYLLAQRPAGKSRRTIRSTSAAETLGVGCDGIFKRSSRAN